MSNEKINKRLEKEQSLLPWYVNEYLHSKSIVPYSTVTLYEYSKEFRRFFEWLLNESIYQETSIKNISLSQLNQLKKEDLELYKSFLMSAPKMGTVKDNRSRSFVTVQRSITALRSLFKYLSSQTENKNNEPYLSTNVMLKIENVKTSTTLQERSRSIEKKLLLVVNPKS